MATKREKELITQIKVLRSQLDSERNYRRNIEIKKYKNETIVIVSNRLPVTLWKDKETGRWKNKMATGGLATGMASLKITRKWIGWVGMDIEPEDRPEVESLLKEINCIPVYIPKKLSENYYNGFSNDVLWPILHYVQLPIETLRKEKEYWKAYKEANFIFSKVVLENSNLNDKIWVHDYHLMVLPEYIRKTRPKAKIGWFLHTPFPNCDIYRTLSYRSELLRGILSCDLAGFHIYNYVRNFKNACSEILGCDSGADAIDFQGKLTLVEAFPIGIDVKKFEKVLRLDGTREEAAKLRQRHGNTKIVIGVDRLDYIKGIMHKFLALEHFLENNPKWTNNITYVQIAVPTRTEVPEYKRLSENVHELVGRINGKFSNLTHVPIHYMDQSVDIDTLVGLYNIADACLVTSLRDGMNLVSLEFVASQTEKPGVLILSEFVGSAQSLGAGSIQINPWNIEEVSNAILKALTMSEEKKREMFSYSFNYVTEHTSQKWAEDFVFTLKQSWEISNFLYKEPRIPANLSFDEIINAFRKSKKRIIFLGVVGTLTTFPTSFKTQKDSKNEPHLSKRNKQNLKTLSKDSKTTLITATSRRREFAEKIFSEIPAIFCAENGYYLKDNREKFEWRTLEPLNLSWMEAAEKVMLYFCERTPRSFIERMETSISWHYRDCMSDFSAKQAMDLISNLQMGPLLNSATEVIHDRQNFQITVRMISLNKTYAIFRAIKHLEHLEQGEEAAQVQNEATTEPPKPEVNGEMRVEEEEHEVEKSIIEILKNYDFVLCVGSYFDSDQDVFSALTENNKSLSSPLLGEGGQQTMQHIDGEEEETSANKSIFTVSVGRRKSLANVYLPGCNEVETLLESLAEIASEKEP